MFGAIPGSALGSFLVGSRDLMGRWDGTQMNRMQDQHPDRFPIALYIICQGFAQSSDYPPEHSEGHSDLIIQQGRGTQPTWFGLPPRWYP